MISADFFITFLPGLFLCLLFDLYFDPRRHKLRISPLAVRGRVRSLRCASLPNVPRCSGLTFGLLPLQHSRHSLCRLTLGSPRHIGVDV